MKRDEGPVPKFVDSIISHLMKVGMYIFVTFFNFFENILDFNEIISGPDLEGVFRISAMKSTLDSVQSNVDAGKTIDFSDLDDPHISAALFKQFLRELPEPLLTFELYGEFIKANSIEDDAALLAELKRLINKLPEVNRAILKRLLELLAKIADKEDINKMGPTNLSTVIGPNILYDKTINPLTMVEDMENANAIIVTLITRSDEIFRIEDPLEAAKENDYKSIVRLYQDGKDFSVKDKNGLTVLHYAAKHANLETVEFVLAKAPCPVDINHIDAFGKTVRYQTYIFILTNIMFILGINVFLSKWRKGSNYCSILIKCWC